jgi:hypothetical protein
VTDGAASLLNETVKASSLYALEDGKLVRKKAEYLPASKLQEAVFKLPMVKWLSSNSNLFGMLRERGGGLGKKLLFRLQAAISGGDEGDAAPVLQQAPRPGKTEPPAPAKLAIAILREMQRITEEADARFLVFDIPQHQGRDRYWSTFPCGPDGNTHGLLIYSPADEFNKHKSDPKIDFRGEVLFSLAGGHFSPLGNQIAGDGLAKFVLKQGLLDHPAAARAAFTQILETDPAFPKAKDAREMVNTPTVGVR